MSKIEHESIVIIIIKKNAPSHQSIRSVGAPCKPMEKPKTTFRHRLIFKQETYILKEIERRWLRNPPPQKLDKKSLSIVKDYR